MRGIFFLVILLIFSFIRMPAQGIMISEKNGSSLFPVVAASGRTVIYVDKNDHWLMHRAAELFRQDLEMLTGQKATIISILPKSSEHLIIIGSLDSSDLIKKLAAENKIQTAGLVGQWEKCLIQTVDEPVKGVRNALIISGSDKRGTAYAVFELSKQMGVSPWYWWADVPVKKKKEIFIRKLRYVDGSPSVKYRGIFINDEAPAFSGWAKEKFGGINHLVYEKVFELMLRLKANYLWPAMWGNAFNDDDPLNPALAQQYGIVMGTTHHEPMLRAQQEWKRYGKGPWNYDSNEVVLKDFWRKGIENMDSRESIVSIGMRGDGDMPMTLGSNIALLERIVRDQRSIIADVTHKPALETPQLWALYKEVQDYYDKGMTVPDDVTLLLCDDNWGNLRKLPKLTDHPRTGGYGIYYHFDYVGDPRNYKWLNTNNIPRVWEQMNLAFQYGADRIWIVNVGDLKPMELPVQFFLDFAWNTKKWNASNIAGYIPSWSENIFGKTYARDIAEILSSYTKYNSRRKPELLSPDTYSLIHYREAEIIEEDYDRLAVKAEYIYQKMPPAYRNAYDQLVLYPVKACANLNKLYVAASKNRLYAAQGRASTNDQADSVKKYFETDASLSTYYNTVMSGGKWNHMMDQTHIGYTYWQQPDKNVMPELQYIQLNESDKPGLAIEGSDAWWPHEKQEAVLPEFNCFLKQSRYFELFNRGVTPFEFSIHSPVSWIKISYENRKIEKQQRVWIRVNWKTAPFGVHKIPLTISTNAGGPMVVFVVVNNSRSSEKKHFKGFIETDGYVSMEAVHYTRSVNVPPLSWQLIPGIGRTGSGMTIQPVTADRQTPGPASPRLEFDMLLYDTGKIQVDAYFSPSLNFNGHELKYAISFDNEQPQIINLHADDSLHSWEKWVADNIIVSTSRFLIKKPGVHVLKYWMIDPGVVLQKIVPAFRNIEPAYLGPPETRIR